MSIAYTLVMRSTVPKNAISDVKYQSPYELERLALIESLVPEAFGQGHALDLGCGSGAFTRLLKHKGWQVTALIANEQNVMAARRWADEGIVGFLPDSLEQLSCRRFDLVLVLELIEHLSSDSGQELLCKLQAVTGLGARLMLSTPNRTSLEGLKGYYVQEKLLRGQKWNAWDDDHRRIYSAGEMIRLLKAHQWQPRQVLGYWYKTKMPGLQWHLGIGLRSSKRYPLNRLGFNTIIVCESRTTLLCSGSTSR